MPDVDGAEGGCVIIPPPNINAPLPWSIVCDLYESRTGERLEPHSARAYHSIALRKIRTAIESPNPAPASSPGKIVK